MITPSEALRRLRAADPLVRAVVVRRLVARRLRRRLRRVPLNRWWR